MARLFLFLALFLALMACNSPPYSFIEALRQMSIGDYRQAVTTMKPLATNGYPPAQFRLGLMYLYGKGIRQDLRQAAQWLQKAAQQDDMGSQYVLARLYLNGLGVAKSEALALRWLQRLAERGFVPAQYEVGLFYAEGKGVEQDNQQALRWLRQAAENGHPQAIMKLIDVHHKGQLGLSKDPQQAAYWRQLAQPRPF